MHLGFGLRNDVAQIFEAEDVGEGARADNLGGTEFAGGLYAQRIAIDNKADASEALGAQKPIKKGNGDLGFSGASRHCD